MTTTTHSTQGTTDVTTSLTRRNKAGLVVCGLLGLADTSNIALLLAGGSDSDSPGPPAAVLVFGAVMGLVTLAAVVFTWRSGDRLGARVVAGSRVLSALTAVPAFFVDDVSPALVAGAGAGMVVTLVGIWLLLSRPTEA